MRWPAPTSIQIGLQRTVRRFLWIPTDLDMQMRWLEFADIVQQRVEYAHILDSGVVVPEPGWRNIHWSNK